MKASFEPQKLRHIVYRGGHRHEDKTRGLSWFAFHWRKFSPDTARVLGKKLWRGAVMCRVMPVQRRFAAKFCQWSWVSLWTCCKSPISTAPHNSLHEAAAWCGNNRKSTGKDKKRHLPMQIVNSFCYISLLPYPWSVLPYSRQNCALARPREKERACTGLIRTGIFTSAWAASTDTKTPTEAHVCRALFLMTQPDAAILAKPSCK